ncbi:MAG: hypothetical protein OEX02_13620 [Cyclobacteriaceae bacterium]|nr:hypothetical protein [Cyclobacteriaceae bacterium]
MEGSESKQVKFDFDGNHLNKPSSDAIKRKQPINALKLKRDARAFVLDFIFGLLILIFAVLVYGSVAFYTIFWGSIVVGGILIISALNKLSKVF